MSTIKVDTIQTRNGTGEIKVSNPVLQGHTVKVDGINDGDGVLGTGSQIQLHGATPVLDIFSYSATTSAHGGINFMKSASNTVGTNTKVAENDIVGSIQFGGYDGNDFASIAGKIDFQMGGAQNGINANDTAGEMVFYTTPDGSGGSGSTERLRITHTGDTQVKTGNLVMSTSQKGIDFSNFVTSDVAGQQQSTPTAKSEILKDYEQGSFTADIKGTSGSIGSGAGLSNTAYYTKIGRSVHIALTFDVTNLGSWGGNINIGGLPFKCMGAMNFPINIGFNAFSGNQPQNKVALVTASQSYIYFADNTTSATPYTALGTGVYSLNGWYITND